MIHVYLLKVDSVINVVIVFGGLMKEKFLIASRERNYFAKNILISNLSRRSFTKFDDLVNVSTSFIDEILNDTLGRTILLEIFGRVKASRGSFLLIDGFCVTFFEVGEDLGGRSREILILLSGTSHRGVCSFDEDRQTLTKFV